MHLNLNYEEAKIIMEQIYFFNQQFHQSEDQSNLNDFHELMRASKNRCQLMLLKHASHDILWIKKDLNSSNHEWLIGLHGMPPEYAFHIPLYVLQQGLSEEQLVAWNIR